MNVQIIKFVFVTAFCLIKSLEAKIHLDDDSQNKSTKGIYIRCAQYSLCFGLQLKNPVHCFKKTLIPILLWLAFRLSPRTLAPPFDLPVLIYLFENFPQFPKMPIVVVPSVNLISNLDLQIRARH